VSGSHHLLLVVLRHPKLRDFFEPFSWFRLWLADPRKFHILRGLKRSAPFATFSSPIPRRATSFHSVSRSLTHLYAFSGAKIPLASRSAPPNNPRTSLSAHPQVGSVCYVASTTPPAGHSKPARSDRSIQLGRLPDVARAQVLRGATEVLCKVFNRVDTRRVWPGPCVPALRLHATKMAGQQSDDRGRGISAGRVRFEGNGGRDCASVTFRGEGGWARNNLPNLLFGQMI
jgi:hypothetical protein